MPIYLNPFFIIPVVLFWANQYVEKILLVHIPWVHAYLDDLLAMPVVFGITLQVYRWIHPLKGRFVFTQTQVLIGVLYFAFLFEILLPKWSAYYTADLWDVLCYGLGALLFYKKINIPERISRES
jgi:hypothetical protein